MSKWCGDENCLQCADKEPDPYVHLPREEYMALREQNRVLVGALRLVLESWVNGRKVRDSIGAAVLVTAQAALTATSQEGQHGSR